MRSRAHAPSFLTQGWFVNCAGIRIDKVDLAPLGTSWGACEIDAPNYSAHESILSTDSRSPIPGPIQVLMM